MVKLQFGCLPEGVRIDTPKGPVAVEFLKAGDLVIGYQGQPVRVLQIHQYHENPSVAHHLTLHFDHGAEISLSPRHRICGTQARHLKVGDQRNGNVISEIRTLSGVFRSFDLLTEDRGYQIHGMPVNSMIQEMADHDSTR